ncbi:hypothetical protein BN1708_007863 [Verticillium longisporum]|uniref:Uncharacterized protein n=1 Tax=Verticillium longisporum TaxID=100787 RepID=A0A0G4MWV4_VERLO|nr:hypothetical protein BN1708_007863 [Verticillium longisporum]
MAAEVTTDALCFPLVLHPGPHGQSKERKQKPPEHSGRNNGSDTRTVSRTGTRSLHSHAAIGFGTRQLPQDPQPSGRRGCTFEVVARRLPPRPSSRRIANRKKGKKKARRNPRSRLGSVPLRTIFSPKSRAAASLVPFIATDLSARL